MTSLHNKCRLVQLLVAVMVVTVNAHSDKPCTDKCRVIYEVDNQTYNKTYQNYSTMLSALPHHVTSLELPDRCRVKLEHKSFQSFNKLRSLRLRLCDVQYNMEGKLFQGLHTLENLDIDFVPYPVGKCTTVCPSIFNTTEQLKTLSLSLHTSHGQCFRKWKTDYVAIVMRRLPQLEHFILDKYTFRNGSTEIYGDFKLPVFRSLEITHSNLREMPCLSILPNLRHLNLSRNSIRTARIRPDCLKTNNITIDLSDNFIQTLKKDDFQFYNSVKTLSLDFSTTKLWKITSDAFFYLQERNTTITSLTIGHDKSLPYDESFFRNLFTSLQNIKIYRLTLFGKSILLEVDESHAFEFLVSSTLTHFSLTNARIKSVPAKAFAKVTNLEFLDLSHSTIVFIDQHGFSGLHKLKTLILTGNDLSAGFRFDVFLSDLNSATQLHTLVLNNMGHVGNKSETADAYLKSLKYLDLSDNKVEGTAKLVLRNAKTVKANHIQCLCPKPPCLVLKLSSQIETLQMRNSLPCASVLTNHARYPMLSTLDASKNENVSLDSPPLNNINIPRLQSLNLSHNSITHLSNKTFAHVLKLQFIDLSSNKLTTIKQHVFSKLTFLKQLKLNNNFISNIDVENFKGLVYLKSLLLGQNGFDCNCELRPLRDWFQTKGLSEDLLDTCKYPANLRHTSIAKFRLKWIDCDGHIYIVITTSAAGFIILIILLLALTYYRLDIKYWYFFKFKYGNHAATENYMYDAMACYHVDSVAWVKNNLVPQLEEGNEHQFKLCVHDRDFEVGEFIESNIINSMNRSRSIIFVMTKKFMNSEWGQFELEMALMKLPEVKRKFIVMVMLETIPKKQLKAKLRCFTRYLTYIEWPLGDDVEQRERDHFWKKLMLALMHNKQATEVDENTPLLQQ